MEEKGGGGYCGGMCILKKCDVHVTIYFLLWVASALLQMEKQRGQWKTGDRGVYAESI